MKAETDPITEDEWLIRIVHFDKFTGRVPPVSPNAFEPRVKGEHADTTGLSLIREACLVAPEQALDVIAPDKRAMKGLVRIPMTLLLELRLTARPEPIEPVAGHVVIPELNSTNYAANKASFTPTKLRLAEVASENIVLRPSS
ncbi:hypothetical protein [Gemmata sp.]|uniref:hypothetical protein n=1 Tax=Gemmata sp. TaxID=1914242 RepID=UPI003F6E7DF9